MKIIGRGERRDARRWNRIVIRSRGRGAKDVVRANKVCFIKNLSTRPKSSSVQAMTDWRAAGVDGTLSTAPGSATRTWRKANGAKCWGRRIKAGKRTRQKRKGADGQDQRQLEFEEQLESHQGADSKARTGVKVGKR